MLDIILCHAILIFILFKKTTNMCSVLKGATVESEVRYYFEFQCCFTIA